MNILVTGSSGLVGRAVCTELRKDGHTLYNLVRADAKPGKNEIYWNPESGSLDKSALEDLGIQAVVHLAGESVVGRWTDRKKKKVRDSRVNGTKILSEALAHLANPPKVFVCASAVGFYGTRGGEILTEESAPGDGFLASVCQEWEAATHSAVKKGIRVANLRFGVILSREGGALKKMLLPFKLGLGGIIGNGRQYWPWIDIDDVVGVTKAALSQEKLSGPINTVAPEMVTNREFVKTLGRTLFRPTFFSMPASTARLLLGQMAEEMLLASVRVKPAKLEAAGFAFQHPTLQASLKHLLK